MRNTKRLQPFAESGVTSDKLVTTAKVTERAPKGDFLQITTHVLVQIWKRVECGAQLVFVEKSNKHSGEPQNLKFSLQVSDLLLKEQHQTLFAIISQL